VPVGQAVHNLLYKNYSLVLDHLLERIQVVAVQMSGPQTRILLGTLCHATSF
jgi:hypothetical protein